MTRTRTLTVGTLALMSVLTGCGGGGKTVDKVAGKASPTAAGGTCTPSGKGTTDLATKPVFTVSKDTPPTETTSIDIVCGTGAEAVAGSPVEVKYVGVNYADGAEFDSSWKRGATDTLPFTVGGGVINGFSVGTTGMKVGGRREVVIAPKDGYGAGGPVPGGTLVFLIDLVKVG